MERFTLNHTPCGRTRREFLWQVGGGFAGLALIDLLSNDGFFADKAGAQDRTQTAGRPHFPARAKHAVFLFMNGGPARSWARSFSLSHHTTNPSSTPPKAKPIGRTVPASFNAQLQACSPRPALHGARAAVCPGGARRL